MTGGLVPRPLYAGPIRALLRMPVSYEFADILFGRLLVAGCRLLGQILELVGERAVDTQQKLDATVFIDNIERECTIALGSKYAAQNAPRLRAGRKTLPLSRLV